MAPRTKTSPQAGAAQPVPEKPRKKGRPPSKKDGGANGIRAMVVGLSVLRTVARAGRPQPLREIAAASGLLPSRVHRYLASLVAAGFVKQDPQSGDYALGEAVIEIGLVGLAQVDAIRIGVEALRAYCERSGRDGHLSVWGSHGPTVVRWQSGRLGLQMKIEEGRVLPILWSATGRLLAAYRDLSDIAPLLAGERDTWNSEHPGSRITDAQVETTLAAVARQGVASSVPTEADREGALFDPVFSRPDHFAFETVAVPVFDHLGRVPMALTFFGTRHFGLVGDADRVAEVVEVGRAASRRLGHPAS